MASKNYTFELGCLDEDLENMSEINVFEKQVVISIVSTRTVKRICNLISAEKATFQCEKCLAML